MCHDSEEWLNIWTGIDLSIQNWHGEFDEFWPEQLKISNICTLTGCFWPKVNHIWVKKSTEELCLVALKTDAKFRGKLTCAF